MASLLFMAVTASAAAILPRDYPSDDALTACPGYKASNVESTATGLTADLSLAGEACDVYGTDLKNLILEVSYDTGKLKSLRRRETIMSFILGPAGLTRNQTRDST